MLASPDGVHHLIEHIKTLDPVFYHRVFLAIAPQRNALPQLVRIGRYAPSTGCPRISA